MSYLDSNVFSSQNLPFSSSFITAAFEGRTIHLQKILLKKQMAAWIIRQFDYDDKFGKLGGYWAHKQVDMFEGNGESEELNGDDTNKGACLRQHGKLKEKADEQITTEKRDLGLIELWPNVFDTSSPPTLSRSLNQGLSSLHTVALCCPQKCGGIKDDLLWVEAMVVVVHLLPAITSSILSSIIDVKRIITLAGSPFATSDITVNPWMDPNTHPMQNRPQTFVSAFNTNPRLHADLKLGPRVHIQVKEKKNCSADISSCSILCTD